MLPGKKYKPEDVLWMRLAEEVGRHRARSWLIFAGTCSSAALIPNRYRSETVILVVPQRVPGRATCARRSRRTSRTGCVRSSSRSSAAPGSS